MSLFILVIYGLALTFIFLFCMSQLHVWTYYRKSKRSKASSQKPEEPGQWPLVTVQLPIFNEYYVADRLIDSVSAFDYPADKLEIQVLDDSTDETRELIEAKVKSVRGLGIDIKHIHRQNREGYKAGALQNGLKQANGEFIAIFDADFVPNPDFLKATVPYFNDPKTGMVQTRWEHFNKDYSIFTKAQALALDNHFEVEQTGRNEGNFFLNFNGTAGIWRKATIEDAGGWHYDTLTEDLDLSYRAQLKHWHFRFLKDSGSPAELPVELNSIKSQQFRWNKGAAETAKKLFPTILRSKIPFSYKIQAFFHLFNSSIFLCILLCALLSLPALVIKNQGHFPLLFEMASFFLLSLLAICLIYFDAFRQKYKNSWKAFKDFMGIFPLFLCISMGMSLHNGMAVIKGFMGHKSPFIRTPKFNLRSLQDSWQGKKYLKANLSWSSLVEGLLSLYFIAGIIMSFRLGDFDLLPFHLMLTIGFGSVFLATVYHSLSILK